MASRISLLLRKGAIQNATTPRSFVRWSSALNHHVLSDKSVQNRLPKVSTFGSTPLLLYCNQLIWSKSHSVLNNHGSTISFCGVSRPALLSIQKRTFCFVKKESANESESALRGVVLVNSINEAVLDGDLEKMKEFVQNGVSINSITLGLSPLFIACKQGHLHIVKELIKMGVDVNTFFDTESKPLIVATGYNHIEIVKLLLHHGANVDIIGKNGATALFHAAKKNNIEVAKLLLQHKANPNIQNNDNITPLHVAAGEQNLELTQLLLQHKANPNVTNKESLTPLHIACAYRSLEIVKELVKHGASINQVDIYESNALIHSAQMKSHNICSVLE
eukprot:TRINITY_DN4192_c0_g1_i1.p1 TRINITY_DN4192_c0_g1~~TRINITY_DN4192_c0_g1_i1.p1  ORF type:complete len:334 (+),score=73.21 TRINITY_DN4192_c0_g1_i1:169-1170(+)